MDLYLMSFHNNVILILFIAYLKHYELLIGFVSNHLHSQYIMK